MVCSYQQNIIIKIIRKKYIANYTDQKLNSLNWTPPVLELDNKDLYYALYNPNDISQRISNLIKQQARKCLPEDFEAVLLVSFGSISKTRSMDFCAWDKAVLAKDENPEASNQLIASIFSFYGIYVLSKSLF